MRLHGLRTVCRVVCALALMIREMGAMLAGVSRLTGMGVVVALPLPLHVHLVRGIIPWQLLGRTGFWRLFPEKSML